MEAKDIPAGRNDGAQGEYAIYSTTNSATPQQIAEIMSAVTLICPHLADGSGVVELRSPNAGRQGTISGYFSHALALAQYAARLDGKVPAVYITLNPVTPDLLARAANKAVPYAKTSTSDQDIVRRSWFPLDFDPKRPAGVSSTDAEHEAALARAQETAAWLASLGFPAPILADSGNGAHLLYRIDLPNSDEVTHLLRRCIEAVAFRFSDDTVDVDRKVFNAARIWKLYGTLSQKGDNLPERPHRRARLVTVPASLVVAPEEALRTLAATLPEPEQKPSRAAPERRRFDVEGWLAEHNVKVHRSTSWTDKHGHPGRKWILAACPWHDHTDNACYVVQAECGLLEAGCHHNSCGGRGWADLRDAVEGPAWRERERQSRAARLDAQVEEAKQALIGAAEKVKSNVEAAYEQAVIGALAVLYRYAPAEYASKKASLTVANRKLSMRDLERAVKDQARQLRPGLRVLASGQEAPGWVALAETLPDAPHADEIALPAGSPYRLTEGGVQVVKETADGEIVINITRTPVYISHRLEPVGGYDEPIKYRVWWRGHDGAWRAAVAAASQLLDKRGVVRLADTGLPVSSNNATDMVAWLAHIVEEWWIPRERVVDRNGWLDDHFSAFLLGGRTYRAEGVSDDIHVLHTQEATAERLRAFSPMGDEDTQAQALLQMAEKYPLLWCVYGAVAAAPLWRYAHQAGIADLRGIVFEVASHASGRGKSVTAEAGLSLFGAPRKLTFPANTTVTGLEVTCSNFRDTAIAIEDFQASRNLSKSETALELAHLIGLGEPRNRANIHLQTRGIPPFHITLLVATEQSILSIADATEGVKHRIYSIEPPFGEGESSQARADAAFLRETLADNHGWPAVRYLPALASLLATPDTRAMLKQLIREFQQGTETYLDELRANSMYYRAAPIVATVQAALFLLLVNSFGWAEAQAAKQATVTGRLLIDQHMSRVPHLSLAQRILQRVASLLASEPARFAGCEPGRDPENENEDLPGYGRGAQSYLGARALVKGEDCICVFPDKFERVIADAGWGRKEALDSLDAAGLLVKNRPEERTSTIHYKAAGDIVQRSARAYCIPSNRLFGE